MGQTSQVIQLRLIASSCQLFQLSCMCLCECVCMCVYVVEGLGEAEWGWWFIFFFQIIECWKLKAQIRLNVTEECVNV